LSNSVFADCQNGSCLGTPFRNWNGVGSIAYSGENPFSSSCRVVVLNGGVQAVGSGIAISSTENECAVLTVSHLANREGQKVRVKFRDGEVYDGVVSVVSRGSGYGDSAVLLIKGKAPSLVKFSEEDVSVGSTVYVGGFGGDGVWRAWKSHIVGFTNDGNYIIAGGARQGDSGGPVWTEGGLVGLISATDGRTTICTSYKQLCAFFSGRNVFPWNAWLEDRKNARRNGESVPPVGAMPLPKRYNGGDIYVAPVPGQGQSQGHGQGVQPIIPGGSGGGQYYTDPSVYSRLDDLDRRLRSIEQQLGVMTYNGKDFDTLKNDFQTIKKKTDELHEGLDQKIKDYLLGWFPTIFGASSGMSLLTTGVVGFILFWLLRRDIKNRVSSGDPLGVEKLGWSVANRTPWKWDDTAMMVFTNLLNYLSGKEVDWSKLPVNVGNGNGTSKSKKK